MNRSRLSLLSAAVLAGAGAMRGDAPPVSWLDSVHVTDSVTTEWDRNISHTTDGPSRSNAMAWQLSVAASRPQQLTPDWLLELGAGAEVLAIPRFDRNSTVNAGLRLGLQRKFGLGPLAPVLQFDAAGRYQSARSRGDAGGTAEAGVRLTKRLNPVVKVAVHARWFEHYADHATFALAQRTLSVEATWDITDRWRLSGSAGRLAGGIVGHAEGADWDAAVAGSLGPAVANYFKGRAHEVTDSYGAAWVSYNVEAHADQGSLTLACELSERTTLELRAARAEVVYKVGLRYPIESWGLSLIHRF